MNRPILLTAAVSIGLAHAAPAGAKCLNQVADLEQRLSQVDTEREEQVQLDTGSGQAAVSAEEEGVEPKESWHGDSISVDTAAQQLEDARSLAEEGDEAGCVQKLDQASRMIEELGG